jgi:adenylyltransferase/sulfurtransferase
MNYQESRYHRQITMDGWGPEVQERLAAARVFVAGVGGLGCPVTMNLALAGVGHLKICDADTVDVTNLNRQFLHCEANVGMLKTASARNSILSLNSQVEIETVPEKITSENVDDLVGDAEIILDCLDNFTARHAIGQCAVRKGVPLVHGAVWGMEGRITVFHPPDAPCLHCIFPEIPAHVETPVLGGVTSAVGSIQAIEAIRFLAGEVMSLKGRMLIMDFSAMCFQELALSRNPACPVCGQQS